MLLGVIAEEELAAAAADQSFANVVFQCSFNEANGATTATDESPIGATLTFHGGAAVSTAEGLATQFTPGMPGALYCPADGDFVTAPHNAAYDSIGDGDFTVEFDAIVTALDDIPRQWIGVWDEIDPTKQSWRVVSDRTNVFFQYRQGGKIKFAFVWSEASRILNVWRRWAFCRRVAQDPHTVFDVSLGVNTIRFFVDSTFVTEAAIPGKFDAAPGTPLYVGGSNGVLAAKGYMQLARVSKCDWSSTSAAAYPKPATGFGRVFAEVVPAADAFYSPVVQRANFVSGDPASFLDDVIYPPTVTPPPQTLQAPLHVEPFFDDGTVNPTFTTSTPDTTHASRDRISRGPIVRRDAGPGRPTYYNDTGTIADYSVSASLPSPAPIIPTDSILDYNGGLLLGFVWFGSPTGNIFSNGVNVSDINANEWWQAYPWQVWDAFNSRSSSKDSIWLYRTSDVSPQVGPLVSPVITWEGGAPLSWRSITIQLSNVSTSRAITRTYVASGEGGTLVSFAGYEAFGEDVFFSTYNPPFNIEQPESSQVFGVHTTADGMVTAVSFFPGLVERYEITFANNFQPTVLLSLTMVDNDQVIAVPPGFTLVTQANGLSGSFMACVAPVDPYHPGHKPTGVVHPPKIPIERANWTSYLIQLGTEPIVDP